MLCFLQCALHTFTWKDNTRLHNGMTNLPRYIIKITLTYYVNYILLYMPKFTWYPNCINI